MCILNFDIMIVKLIKKRENLATLPEQEKGLYCMAWGKYSAVI
jgi:hypothetical protein